MKHLIFPLSLLVALCSCQSQPTATITPGYFNTGLFAIEPSEEAVQRLKSDWSELEPVRRDTSYLISYETAGFQFKTEIDELSVVRSSDNRAVSSCAIKYSYAKTGEEWKMNFTAYSYAVSEFDLIANTCSLYGEAEEPLAAFSVKAPENGYTLYKDHIEELIHSLKEGDSDVREGTVWTKVGYGEAKTLMIQRFESGTKDDCLYGQEDIYAFAQENDNLVLQGAIHYFNYAKGGKRLSRARMTTYDYRRSSGGSEARDFSAEKFSGCVFNVHELSCLPLVTFGKLLAYLSDSEAKDIALFPYIDGTLYTRSFEKKETDPDCIGVCEDNSLSVWSFLEQY